LHAGSATRTNTETALLVRLGLTGPPTIFEGRRGVFALYGGAAEGTTPVAGTVTRIALAGTAQVDGGDLMVIA
jgi:2-methylcitrate dehydratase PrpD